MKKILAFAGSNNSNSITHKFVNHVASQFKEEFKVKVLRLVNYPLPMYSEDEERKGFSGMLLGLKHEISEVDALIICVNEHNGSFSAFFKNVLDWLSRLDSKFLEEKKILLMSTSPGKKGGIKALEYGKDILPDFGAQILQSFSFPSFHENFSMDNNTVENEILAMGLKEVIETFSHQIQID